MTDALNASSGSDSPSTQSEHRICALCTTPARYKCPRCAIPTCSLSCSRRHKQDTRCTGERDKARYVPMNTYGWGTMMRDYCYLEDIGRKVGEWGNEIIRGGYMENVRGRKGVNARRPGKPAPPGKSKRETFRAHLEALEIDVGLLPAGMERRTLNQSTFDQKSKSPLLTIEFVFYPPTTLVSVSSSPPPSYRIHSHRNSLSATLLAALQRHVTTTLSKSQKQKEIVPDWVPSIITPHPEAPECFVPPRCYIRANLGLPHAPNVVYYHQLEPTLSLGELLRGTSFEEFPTVHIFDQDASSFCGTVIDKSGSIIQVLEDDHDVARVVKRRKLNKVAGLKTVFSLVGEYGSGDDSHSEEETTRKHMAGLATLEAYSASDSEVALTRADMEEDEEYSLSSDGDAASEGGQLDPERLLELVKQARGAADEDILDWGDEWDIDADDQDVGH